VPKGFTLWEVAPNMFASSHQAVVPSASLQMPIVGLTHIAPREYTWNCRIGELELVLTSVYSKKYPLKLRRFQMAFFHIRIILVSLEVF
jgi:hypothetical protein